MKSFKDYTPQSSRTQTPASGEETATAAELTKKIAAAFDGRPSSEMLKSILDEAERSKRAGTLTNEEIDAFYAQFAPLLNPVQRIKLKSVTDRLKKI